MGVGLQPNDNVSFGGKSEELGKVSHFAQLVAPQIVVLHVLFCLADIMEGRRYFDFSRRG